MPIVPTKEFINKVEGPKTIISAIRPMAKMIFRLDSIFTPLPIPDKAETTKQAVQIRIIITCTVAVFGMPNK